MVLLPRRAPLLAALAPVLLALTGVVAGCGSGSGARRRLEAPAGQAAYVTVVATAPAREIPFGFLGLSLEYPSIEAYAGTDPSALDPVFEQLVRTLAPGQSPVLRIGGDSTDRTWWPAPGLVRPGGIRFAISKRWLDVTRALAGALHARVIAGLNLEADDPALAAAEARALINGLGPGRIRALELGNEPDLYASFPLYRTADGRQVMGRSAGYDTARVASDFTRFAAALPPSVLAGPSLGAPRWTRALGRFLIAEPRVGLVTLHRYPLQLCFARRSSPRYPTVARLLSPAASIGLADSFARYAAVARADGRSLRIDELNTVSCGADPSVSQTFASALWALNTLFEMARVGIHGVNMHTFPGAGYELFRISRRGGRWQATVGPEYYGLVLFARAAPAGSRLVEVDDAADGSVRTWATRDEHGKLRVLMVNTGSTAREVSLRIVGVVPGRPASVERLTAPGVRANWGVTLAGQRFGSPTFNGRLVGRRQITTIAATGGRYAVAVPAGSAALLVVSPRPSGST